MTGRSGLFCSIYPGSPQPRLRERTAKVRLFWIESKKREIYARKMGKHLSVARV
jgi:hypothetical protein